MWPPQVRRPALAAGEGRSEAEHQEWAIREGFPEEAERAPPSGWREWECGGGGGGRGRGRTVEEVALSRLSLVPHELGPGGGRVATLWEVTSPT